MRAVVLYESMTGNTREAARLIAAAARNRGHEASVYDIARPNLEELAKADVVFVGTWVDGLILVGHRPGRAGKIKKMPVLTGKSTACFMTYAINPGDAIRKLERMVSERGGNVVARHAFHRHKLLPAVEAFTEQVLDRVGASTSV
ncbi:MAG TPA: flavodoxin domain-containing protein [Acidimicrobiales bacterium]|jgi:hypothetical protein